MITKMDAFNNDNKNIEESRKVEEFDINPKLVLAYNEEVSKGYKGSILDYLKDKGFSGLCVIEKLSVNNTYNLAMIQAYFGTRKLYVGLKGSEALEPCTIDAILKEDKGEAKASVKVFVDDKRIKLGDITSVAVNLDETVKLKRELLEEELEEKLKQMNMDNLDDRIKELVKQAISEGLDFEYVATVSPKYKHLELVIPFLKHKLRVTDYITDKTSEGLVKAILVAVEQIGSRIKDLDLSRGPQLIVIDAMCVKAGFKLFEVYDEHDEVTTAQAKLKEAIVKKNRQIYYASFDKRNVSFVDFPADLFESYVNLVKNYNAEKELKLDIRGFMLGNNLEGIYKLPISVEDFIADEEMRMEFNVNNSCLVSLKNTPIMMRNLVVSEGELFAGVNKLDKENLESLYIECLPATENRVIKSRELCKELGLPYFKPQVTEELMDKYLEDLKTNEGRYMSFTRMLKAEGFNGLASLDVLADKEKLALCLEKCSVRALWYDRNYGFRIGTAPVVVGVTNSGAHTMRIKFDDYSISLSKFVSLQVDVDYEANNTDELKKYMIQQYEEKLIKEGR